MEQRNNGRSREPFEDQVSSDVGDVIQAPESDLMTRGLAVDLFKVTNQGTQGEAAEHKKLTGEEGFPGNNIIVDDRTSHRTFCRQHSGTLNESTNFGVKTDRSRVGSPELCVRGSKVTGDKGDMIFTQVWALLTEVIPYFLLD